MRSNNGYGIVASAIDLILTAATGGLWLIYLIFKGLRKG